MAKRVEYQKTGSEIAHRREVVGNLPDELVECLQSVAKMKEDVTDRIGSQDERIDDLSKRIAEMEKATASMRREIGRLKSR